MSVSSVVFLYVPKKINFLVVAFDPFCSSTSSNVSSYDNWRMGTDSRNDAAFRVKKNEETKCTIMTKVNEKKRDLTSDHCIYTRWIKRRRHFATTLLFLWIHMELRRFSLRTTIVSWWNKSNEPPYIDKSTYIASRWTAMWRFLREETRLASLRQIRHYFPCHFSARRFRTSERIRTI